MYWIPNPVGLCAHHLTYMFEIQHNYFWVCAIFREENWMSRQPIDSTTTSQVTPSNIQWHSGLFGTFLVAGFNHFLVSISYMGCHPSHWLSYFSRWFFNHQPVQNCLVFFFYFLLEHRGSLSQGVLGDCPERINPKSTGQSSFGLPGLVMTNIATV